jgi:MFS transporter, SP family, general alpha glucoside:H+ symporter
MPFIVQWVWIIPLLLIVYFAPTSPWWLVRQGRLDHAKNSIRRLTNPEHFSDEDAKNMVAMMVHTNELEKQAMAGATYLDCFRGTDRRRTEIVSFSLVSRITYSLTFFQGYDDFRYATSLW